MALDRSSFVRAVVLGGSAAGVLDALDAVVAFKLVSGFDPMPVYQFVASGMLGPSAFAGGVATALLGLAVHFLIAFAVAGVFATAAWRWPALLDRALLSGAVFGIGVWAVMNLVVIPLSKTPPSPFNLALFLNGVIGHALLVGMPIALVTRACSKATSARRLAVAR
jgi:hypothetical protein